MFDAKEALTRQMDLIPINKLGADILIIGAGAVGSWASFALAKMGYLNQTVMDYDTVDNVNLNCQFFPADAIGKPKVTALHDLIKQFTTFDINVVNAAWKGELILSNITIAAVDSMEVRKGIFNACRSRWLIDGRMASEYMTLYVVDMHNPERKAEYAKSLHSDADAMQEKCTGKSTIYCANIIGGMVAKAVKNVTCDGLYAKMTSIDLKNNAYLALNVGE